MDVVKIDRSFTRSAVDDGGARRRLTSIVRVCQADQGQGWHFGRAVPAEDVRVVLSSRLPGPRSPHEAVASRR